MSCRNIYCDAQSKVTYPQIIQVCKVCEGERRGGEGVCKSSAKAGRQVGQFVCLLMTIFVDMVMVIVDVLCYAYAAVYQKCAFGCFTNIKFWKFILHKNDSWSCAMHTGESDYFVKEREGR